MIYYGKNKEHHKERMREQYAEKKKTQTNEATAVELNGLNRNNRTRIFQEKMDHHSKKKAKKKTKNMKYFGENKEQHKQQMREQYAEKRRPNQMKLM